jgi:hypothetical protein
MATKPPKKSRKERRADRAIAKESNTTLGLNCLGPNCGKPTKVKKQNTSKKKRQGSEQRLYVASERTSHINPTTSSERTPGMDVSHGVTGGNKDGRVDYVADNAKANKALAQSIGGKVTSDVGSPTTGGIEETTNGGLKRDYYRKGLYKKARSGDVSRIKGYSTYSEGGHQKELIKTTRGGDVSTFKSTEGMTKGEKQMRKKHARKQGDNIRYISEERLEKKTDRTSKRLDKRKGDTGVIWRGKDKEKFLGQTQL